MLLCYWQVIQSQFVVCYSNADHCCYAETMSKKTRFFFFFLFWLKAVQTHKEDHWELLNNLWKNDWNGTLRWSENFIPRYFFPLFQQIWFLQQILRRTWRSTVSKQRRPQTAAAAAAKHTFFKDGVTLLWTPKVSQIRKQTQQRWISQFFLSGISVMQQTALFHLVTGAPERDGGQTNAAFLY